MRMPVLLATAALFAAPTTASAAVVTYGVDTVGGPEEAAPGYGGIPRAGGTFVFDTDANQLLSFDYRPGYPTSFNAEPQILALFNAAGPCDLECFIGALNGSTFTSTSTLTNNITTTVAFGTPLNGQLVYQAPFNVGFASLSGSLQVTGPVPEPGTWALMLLGFGAIGWATRRQRMAAALSGSPA